MSRWCRHQGQSFFVRIQLDNCWLQNDGNRGSFSKHRPWFGSQISYTTSVWQWQWWEAPRALIRDGSDWIVGSHGHSLYRVKTSMIRCWRWIWGSQLCGPKGPQSSKTSQGLASQIGTPQVRQGVRRPLLILTRTMSEIRRAIRTSPSPSSRRSIWM